MKKIRNILNNRRGRFYVRGLEEGNGKWECGRREMTVSRTATETVLTGTCK
jgi:hypothetical protein